MGKNFKRKRKRKNISGRRYLRNNGPPQPGGNEGKKQFKNGNSLLLIESIRGEKEGWGTDHVTFEGKITYSRDGG